MRSLVLVLAALTLAAAPSVLRADEITLKSGEVLKNVKIIKKSDDRWRVRMPDGQRRLIDVAEIASHVEKPTAGEELEEKADKLDRKDVAGMLELGRWGMENGAELEARKLLAKVIAVDEENLEARKLLGHEKGDDGKWRYGRDLERYNERRREAEYEALGWEKVDGEWVTPYVARRLKAKLVEKDGEWHTREHLDQLAAGKVWVEGTWYEAADQARLDAGERMSKGKWVPISELDAQHADVNDPWEIETRHWFIRGSVKHATITRVAITLEQIWQPLVDLFGDAPLAVDRATKPEIFVVNSRELYTKIANDSKPRPRQNAYTDLIGAQLIPGRGAMGYWYDSQHSLGWFQHAAAHAFLDEIHQTPGMTSSGFEAIGAYFEGYHDGVYKPDYVVLQYIKNWDKPSPFDPFTDFRLEHVGRTAMDLEAQFARLGFAFHYMYSRKPELVRAWAAGFVRGDAHHRDLIARFQEAMGDTDPAADFAAFREAFLASWQAPKLP